MVKRIEGLNDEHLDLYEDVSEIPWFQEAVKKSRESMSRIPVESRPSSYRLPDENPVDSPAMDDTPCGTIRILKQGPEDYLVFVDEHNSGSDTSFGAESVAEGINEALSWMGLEVSVTVG